MSTSARKHRAAAAASAAGAADATERALTGTVRVGGAAQGAIATALAAATASLLGSFAGSGAAVAQEPADRKWNFDLALHSYQESERVGDYSGTFLVRRAGKNGREFRLLFTIDSLTGASASGAVPAGRAQTFTSPSGKKYYTTPAAEVPLDPDLPRHPDRPGREHGPAAGPTLEDRRRRLGLERVGLPPHRRQRHLHPRLQRAPDHVHAGSRLRLDTIDPEGGRPLPLAAMLPVGVAGNKATAATTRPSPTS